jgi:putative DNA primase/helicase
MNARNVVGLAERGFPVSSDTARHLTKYISDFETTNFSMLPCRQISSHLGWVAHEQGHGFLWGRTLLSGTRRYAASELDQPVLFHGDAIGDEQIAAGYHATGSIKQWCTAVRFLVEHPRAFVAFMSSFAPPLLEVVKAPNFSVDLSNPTSTGKTTTLRVGASVWGKPDERAADGALTTWDNTRVFIERASSVVSALPLILDDTKRAKEPQLVADIIYAVSSGRGRGRGALTGLERTRVWRTVLISSGEAPAVTFTQDGGTRTRVLTIRGQPFGRADAETGEMVRQLNLAIQSHYGHAGPTFVEYLLRHRENWTSFAEQYRVECARLASQSTTPEVGRLAELMGVITLAARLASDALGLDWDWEEPIQSVWAQIVATAADAPGEIRALQDVMGFAYANQEAFHGREGRAGMDGEIERVPARGWLGEWARGSKWEHIAFFPTVLRDQLTNAGYQPDAILGGWRDRGWLEVEADQSHPYTKRVKFGGERPRFIVIKREAIDAADV